MRLPGNFNLGEWIDDEREVLERIKESGLPRVEKFGSGTEIIGKALDLLNDEFEKRG